MEKVTLTPLGRCATALFAWAFILFNAGTLSESLSPFGCALVAALLLLGTYVFLRGQGWPPAAMVLLSLGLFGCHAEPVPGCWPRDCSDIPKTDLQNLPVQPFPKVEQGFAYYVPHRGDRTRTLYSTRCLELHPIARREVYLDGQEVFDTLFKVKTCRGEMFDLDQFYASAAADSAWQLSLRWEESHWTDDAAYDLMYQIRPIHAPR